MDFNLWSFILENFEAAGVIGGYVSISIIGVALITFLTRKSNKVEGQMGPKWAHPLIGALLGLIPGCGATIVVSSLYKNKKISFGGLFATFTSTLGEGSFVLLGASDEADVASNLQAYLTISIVGFIAGVILGYVLDAFGFRANFDNMQEKVTGEQSSQSQESTFANYIVHGGFYIIIAIAVFLAPGSIMALWGGGIDAIADVTVWVAIALTFISIIYYIANTYIYKGHDCSFRNDLKTTLLHSVLDITMVVTFVFIGLFVANYIIDVLVGAETFDAWMTSSASIVVLLAALIGVMPGCGGMIAVTVAFITIPNFPMAGLIAAAIATSGDGLFPLLAENRKDGVIISVAGFVVALVVGYTTLALGI